MIPIRHVGETFLNWLAPESRLRWLDVGCGNGAFTEMVVERCAPVSVLGIDPSEAQLAFARTRPASRVAHFRHGDAMTLPFPDDTFDVAVMPLVIFFVPDPARGVAEMARVVRPDGTVADFDDYWTTIFGAPSVGSKLAAMTSEDLAVLKVRVRARLSSDATGRITYSARANAVKGRVPNQLQG